MEGQRTERTDDIYVEPALRSVWVALGAAQCDEVRVGRDISLQQLAGADATWSPDGMFLPE